MNRAYLHVFRILGIEINTLEYGGVIISVENAVVDFYMPDRSWVLTIGSNMDIKE